MQISPQDLYDKETGSLVKRTRPIGKVYLSFHPHKTPDNTGAIPVDPPPKRDHGEQSD